LPKKPPISDENPAEVLLRKSDIFKHGKNIFFGKTIYSSA